eukprot:3713011-Rhodomonas_salina.2
MRCFKSEAGTLCAHAAAPRVDRSQASEEDRDGALGAGVQRLPPPPNGCLLPPTASRFALALSRSEVHALELVHLLLRNRRDQALLLCCPPHQPPASSLPASLACASSSRLLLLLAVVVAHSLVQHPQLRLPPHAPSQHHPPATANDTSGVRLGLRRRRREVNEEVEGEGEGEGEGDRVGLGGT